GEVDAFEFMFHRPNGKYEGSKELKKYSKSIYKLAKRIEKELGCPQDIEWAIERNKLYLLQSRPITTLFGHNIATGEWNDSYKGNFLWSNSNAAEALPDVMTPSTWSLWQKFHLDTIQIKIPNFPIVGNIGGRCYFNFSLLYSIYNRIMRNPKEALHRVEELLGYVPKGVEIPMIPITKSDLFMMFLSNLPWEIKYIRLKRKIPQFIDTTPRWCHKMHQRIQVTKKKIDLISLWHKEIKPYLYNSFWMIRASAKVFMDPAEKLSRELDELDEISKSDAKILLSSFSSKSDHLASLGPLIGLYEISRGKISREDYLVQYGHRGPYECEISNPYPLEEQKWIDLQLIEFSKSLINVEALLEKQVSEFEATLKQFQELYPKRGKSVKHKIDKISLAAHKREAVRSESIRVVMVVRKLFLKAGELTHLGDDIFFLSIDELLNVLAGEEMVIKFIPVRKDIYIRHKALPQYPVIIKGGFNPFQWAADPNRRNDFYDSQTSIVPSSSDTITGFAGAAGSIEGVVRRLDNPEEGEQLKPGEILVTTLTNIGWTPLFPRAAAIITDTGAPLSHAAIIARELGIPAVVGCGDATMRLQTGDRVVVDGGRGIVKILESTKSR
ncbi:MAG: PEP-utilizing enzyme, partial [Candidatus Hodarchaeota archaeon]